MNRPLAMLVLAAVMAGGSPAFAQTPPDPTQSDLRDINGRKCTPGAGVTICPTPSKVGDVDEYADILGDLSTGQEIGIGFCVAESGVLRNLEILQSSGRPRIDAKLLKHFQTWRYKPGTVDGKPALICGMRVTHVAKHRP